MKILSFMFLAIIICTSCNSNSKKNENTFLVENYEIESEYFSHNKVKNKITVSIKNDNNSKIDKLFFQVNTLVRDLIVKINGKEIGYTKEIYLRGLEYIIIDYHFESTSNAVVQINYNVELQENSLDGNQSSYFLYGSLGFPIPNKVNTLKPFPFSISIKAPKELKFLVSGKLIEQSETNTGFINYKFVSKSISFPYIVCGNFNEQLILKEKVSFNYFIPENLKYSYNHLNEMSDALSEIIDFYTQLWGKPKSEKFNIAFIERRGGYAPKGTLLLNTQYLNELNSATIKLLAHEIAHNWWGSGVHFKNSFLGESLAQYSAALYLNKNENKNLYKEFSLSTFIKGSTYNFNNLFYTDKNYRLLAYNTAPQILHLVENSLGIKNFNNVLKEIYLNYVNKLISLEQFIDIFGSHDNAAQIMKYYFDGNTWADYSIQKISTDSIEISVTNNVFDVILPIGYKTNDQTVIDSIHIPKSKIPYSNTYKVKIDCDTIIIDPEFNLLQSDISNDSYIKTKSLQLVEKFGLIYDKKYYVFFDLLLNSFNNDNNTNYDMFSNNSKVIEVFTKIGNIMSVTKYLLILDEKKKWRTIPFTLYLRFSYNEHKNVIGYIQGTLEHENGNIKIENYTKINM